MTQKARKQAKALRLTTRRYSASVKRKLSESGAKPSAAVVESAAKYYPALKKLAEK
jgi:hypothetical protein